MVHSFLTRIFSLVMNHKSVVPASNNESNAVPKSNATTSGSVSLVAVIAIEETSQSQVQEEEEEEKLSSKATTMKTQSIDLASKKSAESQVCATSFFPSHFSFINK